MSLHRSYWPGLVAVLMVAGLGCSSKAKPVKFDGLVTYDDKPLGGATVQFIPLDTRGQPALGVTDSNGVVRLTTYNPEDGVLPGDYKITVKKMKGDRASDTKPSANNKMEWMANYQKIAKEITLEQYDPKKWTLIPLIYANGDKTPLKCQVPPPEGKLAIPLRSTEGP